MTEMSQATNAPRLYDYDVVLYGLQSAVLKLESALVAFRSVGLTLADLPQTVVVFNMKEKLMSLHLQLFRVHTDAREFHDAVLQAAAPMLNERPSAKGLSEVELTAVYQQLQEASGLLDVPIDLARQAADEVKAASYLLPEDFYNDAFPGAIGLMLEAAKWSAEASKIEKQLEDGFFAKKEEENE